MKQSRQAMGTEPRAPGHFHHMLGLGCWQLSPVPLPDGVCPWSHCTAAGP